MFLGRVGLNLIHALVRNNFIFFIIRPTGRHLSYNVTLGGLSWTALLYMIQAFVFGLCREKYLQSKAT
jgi:hypothetical protein